MTHLKTLLVGLTLAVFAACGGGAQKSADSPANPCGENPCGAEETMQSDMPDEAAPADDDDDADDAEGEDMPDDGGSAVDDM